MSFEDPVVRCTECQLMITRGEIQTHGCCPKCGNRRMRSISVISPEERDRLRKMEYDKFLELFEEVEDSCPAS